MACSSRLRVQGNSFLHKNPSNESKPWVYDEKYCVFKFHGRRDERHSKNGYFIPLAALTLLGAKKGVATDPKSSKI